MSKRIHELAKEWDANPKDVLSAAERIGLRGKRTQSVLTDDEQVRVREALGVAQKVSPTVGSERVVAERVVTERDSIGDQLVTAREQTTETRLRPNVIRRRTAREVLSREELASPVAAPSRSSFDDPSESFDTFPPPSFSDDAVPPAMEDWAEVRPHVAEVPPSRPIEPVIEAPAIVAESVSAPIAPVVDEPEALPIETTPAPTPEPTPAVRPRPIVAEPPARERVISRPGPTPSPPPRQAPSYPVPGTQVIITPSPAPVAEAPRGPKVLGRIDLRKAVAPPPGPGRTGPGEIPGATPPPGSPGDPRRKKKGRKVIEKTDLPDSGNRDFFRGGRGRPQKRRALPGKELRKTEITTPRASKRVVRISEVITVGDLAKAMGVKASEVIKRLIDMGMMATINQVIDHDTAVLVAGDFDYQVENVAFDVEQALEAAPDEVSEPVGEAMPRAPVITIMGHVDHGKTSLLDAVRSTEVAAGEAGGITQHIGAYTVDVRGRRVTFLDTPGHEAFTAMRARGAQVTDIVVLVVAADDGIMPQTVEAINHARAAAVPIIVAVNKIDKPGANVERVTQELGNHGLAPEAWGGDTIVIPVSAKTQDGIPQLLDMLLLQADILELKATPSRRAKGTIVEARLDRGRGPVATVLVQEGTLKVGDPFVCGMQFGRIRAMMDDKGGRIEEAGPSTPVEILGLSGVPDAGDVFVSVQDDQKARQVAEHRQAKQRETEMAKTSKVSLDDLYQQIQTGDVRELKVVLKADVQGSVGALGEALARLSSTDVRLAVIHGSVGGITESDVLLASASNAIIIGFSVRPEPKAAALAEREGVDVRLYTIIYDAVNDVRDALEGLLEPTVRENILGRAEVRQVFTVSGAGVIAGCFVVDGKILRGTRARLLRDSVVIHDGKVGSLRRFKEDAREVTSGYECGIGFEGYGDLKSGDVIEAYEMEQVARRLPPATSRGAHAAERSA